MRRASRDEVEEIDAIRGPEALGYEGAGRAQRHFPSPIQLGPRMIAWRESEIVALKAAQVRGAPENEIRELVGMLEAARKLTES